MEAEWRILWDGYYPYCSNCSYEPYREGIQKVCPKCGCIMTNYEKLKTPDKNEKDGYQMLYDLVTEEDKL